MKSHHTMKLSHLPAAFYGLSSSKPLSAYSNYHRRCFRRRVLPIPSASASASASRCISTLASTSAWISTKGRKELQPSRCFQPSPLASHNRRGFHHRYNHQYRNRNRNLNHNHNHNHNLLPIYSADEDNAQQHRQRYQRRGISLSATANNSVRNNTADANDPGDATTTNATTNATTNTATTLRNIGAATDRGNDEVTSEKRSKSPRVPKLRLFYNDVYEVKLPPKHRFPMGKYRKVREKVQNKIAKLPQETRDSVDCGEWNVSV